MIDNIDKIINNNRISYVKEDALERLNFGRLEHAQQMCEFYKIEAVKQIVERENIKNVLEIGCGSGLIALYLQNCNYTGIDLDDEQLIKAKNRNLNNAQFIKHDLVKDDIQINAEFVIALDILEHFEKIEDAKIVIKKIAKLQQTNQYFLVAMPIIPEDADFPCWYPNYHNYEFKFSEFEEVFSEFYNLEERLGLYIDETKIIEKEKYEYYKKIFGKSIINFYFSISYPEISKINLFILRRKG